MKIKKKRKKQKKVTIDRAESIFGYAKQTARTGFTNGIVAGLAALVLFGMKKVVPTGQAGLGDMFLE